MEEICHKVSRFCKRTKKVVRLGLAADGFNLFGNLSQAYSMWPVILTTYNLPPWLCMKESSFMLTLLIPGPKSLGKDIDVYLRPLIEDLKVLWDRKGIETIDVASGQKFNMRAMVLWTINDFPARSSLSGWSGQGYKRLLKAGLFAPGDVSYLQRFMKKLKVRIFPLSTSLNELDNATLHIDGKSTVVDAPPDIIDVPDEDDDIIGDEDTLPRWILADLMFEDLFMLMMMMSSADVARSHGGDGGGDDHPPSHVVPPVCVACFANKVYYCSRCLILRAATYSSRLDRIIRSITCTWQKAYNTKRLLLRPSIGRQAPTTGTYDCGASRSKPDKRQKCGGQHLDRDPGRWLAFEMRWQASDTQEYPSLIDTFWRTHTVDGVFPKDEDRRIYEEMKRLEATGEYTEDEINALARGGKLRGIAITGHIQAKYARLRQVAQEHA
ncbi:hypothetical protein Tco_0824964 [Tanacetum coccineum]